MLQRMPASYQQTLSNGKLACTTCHDLPVQCLPQRRREKMLNPMFLRGAPFKSRTDQCYLCHDAKSYQRINPHDQLNEKGQMRTATCLLCHGPKTMQQITTRKAISEVDYNIEKDLTVPSEPVRARIKTMATKNGIVLPLDPTTGRVYCGTCHNVHEKGLFKNASVTKGADEKHRLRMQKMCANCHEK
jgi:nitrate/TMAO reductase-like tetraheme cytochrome c subunit